MVTWDTLLDQAGKTAKVYLLDAIEAVDECFGEGYAKAHPELVCTFMEICATDFLTGAMIKMWEGEPLKVELINSNG